MKKILLSLPVSLLILAIISSCTSDNCSKNTFEKHFTGSQRDTLMTDMVTLIGRKPKTADWETRHEPQHRAFYIEQTRQFHMTYFDKNADETYYFYMIRPARSPQGNTRGVGGMFTLNSDGKIEYFEELFNTPINNTEELKQIGCTLFTEMTATGSVDKYLWNRDMIEWPDDRLKYDKVKREWRYDVEE